MKYMLLFIRNEDAVLDEARAATRSLRRDRRVVRRDRPRWQASRRRGTPALEHRDHDPLPARAGRS